MGGSTTTPFGDGTYIPDPLAQFLGRVLPWNVGDPPDSFVNIHALGGTGPTYQMGGRAFAGMADYGLLQNFVGFLNHIKAQVFFCLSMQPYVGQPDGRGNRKVGKHDRKAINARWLKSFVLDLDVKPTGYPSQEAALAVLLPFLDEIGLQPGPIISTGNGLHAYIVLDQPITFAIWKPLADRLAEAANQHGLKFDQGVTKNAAVLLRLPTSFNRKDPDNPKECKAFTLGETTTVARVTAALGKISVTPGVSRPQRTSVIDQTVLPPRTAIKGPEANRALAALAHSRIVTSIELLHRACPVVADSERRGGNTDLEPLWFELAKLCHYVQDGRDYFHDLSSEDPRYDPEQTDAKYDQAEPQGWPACATIARSSPAALTLCQGCAFNEQGQSPINYATRGLSGSGAPAVTHMNGSLNGHAASAHIPATSSPIIDIKLPPQFKRLPTGHIVTAIDDVPVFNTAIYDMRLSTSTDGTEKLHSVSFVIPCGTKDVDDVSIFAVPMSAMKSDQSFGEHCFGHGLMYTNFKLVKFFMTSWVEQIRERGDILAMSRMGWLEKDGAIRGFAFGKLSSAPSDYTPIGQLSEWKKGISTFIRKGCVEIEVIIATAFAAPLIRFTGVDGAVVHARGPSGRGKTAALEHAMSVWASKQAVLSSGTHASTKDLIAMAHNLPVYIDEFVVDAKTDFNKFGEFLLNVTTAKEYRRMTRNITQRQRRFSQTLLTTTGNFSLVQKTSRETAAQALRVLEFGLSDAIDRLNLTLDQANAVKRLIENNHGTAGLVYTEYLARCHANIDKIVALCTREFSDDLDATSGERFWLAAIVAIYVGACIARSLELVDFDIVSMKKFLLNLVRQQRATLAEIAIDTDNPAVLLDRIGNFVNHRISSIIRTSGITRQGANSHTKQTIKATPYELKPPYAGRLATEDKVLWLSEAQITGWCQQHGHDVHQMRRLLIAAEYCTRPKNKRSLASGTSMENQPAAEHIWEFDLSKPALEFLNRETGE